MKILHTSDWHLGRTLHAHSLLEDQKDALNQVLKELSNDYDAIIISGDIYDRAVPPQEAVTLFSSFLKEISKQKIQAIIIPGNHDSPERLGFADTILDEAGIHFRCDYSRLNNAVIIKDKKGYEVDIFALPFVEKNIIKEKLDNNNITDHLSATQKALEIIKKSIRKNIPSVLVAHAFVGKNSHESESERIFIGGAYLVPANVFEGFDYVALGHLHKPQKVDKSYFRYSGSLFPYSFSETEYKKEIIRLEFDNNNLSIKSIKLNPLHEVSVLEDEFHELLNNSKYDSYKNNYVSIRLTDDKYHINTFNQLKNRFPLLLELRQIALEAKTNILIKQKTNKDSPNEIFNLFLDYFNWNDSDERKIAENIFIKTLENVEIDRRKA